MFRIKAHHSETFEVNASLDKVRDFFADIKNFVDFMPSIEDIRLDNNDNMHWKIRVQVPVAGYLTEKFVLREEENTAERIEWSPVENENFNLMRYAAEFMPKGKNKTMVQFSQNIELRRKSATRLHFLAGFAGESLISSEMTRTIGEMLREFIGKARERLEN